MVQGWDKKLKTPNPIINATLRVNSNLQHKYFYLCKWKLVSNFLHITRSVLAINYRLNQILLCTYPAIHKNIFYLLATFSDNNYCPQAKFGARLCFYSRVSFCSWGEVGGLHLWGVGCPQGGSASRGGWVDPPESEKRAVCILLECLLV